MPDLTTEDIENAGTEALMNALKIKARQALDDDKWILAATACRMLEELSLDRAITAGAHNAFQKLAAEHENDRVLLERTVAVPLIRPAMLDDTAVRTFRCCPEQRLEGNVAHGCSGELGHWGEHTYPTAATDALRRQRPLSCVVVHCDLPWWPGMEIRDEPGRHTHIGDETRTMST